MKVLLLNGSPRKEGCTFTALNQIAESLNKQGIKTEIFQAGNADMENVKIYYEEKVIDKNIVTHFMQKCKHTYTWHKYLED